MMIKKRIYLIAIIAVIAIVLGCVYAFIVAPLLKSEDKPPELLDGEVLGPNNQILMFEQITRENLQEIEAHNDKGGFTFYYSEEHEEFLLKEYEKAPYSKESFGILIASAGYPLSQKRVTESCDDFSEYGLAESDDPAYYIIRSRSGEEHKVYVGNMIVSGAGYYAKYDGRDAVYIIDVETATDLLAGVPDYISPTLVYPTSQTNYFTIKDFTITKDGKPFVQLTSNTKEVTDENGKKSQELINYEMKYPSNNYTVSSKYDTILQRFQEFDGLYTVEVLKDSETEFSDEILEKYNLKNPKYEIFLEFNGIQNSFVLSEKNEDGTYYAYSLLFNLICVIDQSLVDYVEWDLIEFVDRGIFQYDITNVSSVKIVSKGFEETFLIYNLDTGKETAAGTIVDIEVKRKSTGEVISDTENFRRFFFVLLSTQFNGEAEVKNPEGLEEYARIELITREGKKLEFGFYPYKESRRCLMTLNGKGEFYVLRSSLDKIVSDAQKVINGEPVNRESAN